MANKYDKATLEKAAKELGVRVESLTKTNMPLFQAWLAKQ